MEPARRAQGPAAQRLRRGVGALPAGAASSAGTAPATGPGSSTSSSRRPAPRGWPATRPRPPRSSRRRCAAEPVDGRRAGPRALERLGCFLWEAGQTAPQPGRLRRGRRGARAGGDRRATRRSGARRRAPRSSWPSSTRRSGSPTGRWPRPASTATPAVLADALTTRGTAGAILGDAAALDLLREGVAARPRRRGPRRPLPRLRQPDRRPASSLGPAGGGVRRRARGAGPPAGVRPRARRRRGAGLQRGEHAHAGAGTTSAARRCSPICSTAGSSRGRACTCTSSAPSCSCAMGNPAGARASLEAAAPLRDVDEPAVVAAIAAVTAELLAQEGDRDGCYRTVGRGAAAAGRHAGHPLPHRAAGHRAAQRGRPAGPGPRRRGRRRRGAGRAAGRRAGRSSRPEADDDVDQRGPPPDGPQRAGPRPRDGDRRRLGGGGAAVAGGRPAPRGGVLPAAAGGVPRGRPKQRDKAAAAAAAARAIAERLGAAPIVAEVDALLARTRLSAAPAPRQPGRGPALRPDRARATRSWRCWAPARPTGRSPGSCSSASARWVSTCPAFCISSRSRTGRRPRPSRSKVAR